MVRAWYLSKAMFLSAKTYKINWYGYLINPLLTAIPVAVLAWYGSSFWNLEDIFGLVDLRSYLVFLLIGVAYWNYVEVLWSAIFTLRRYMKNGQFEDIFLSPVNGFEYILGWTVMGIVSVSMQSLPLVAIAVFMNLLNVTFIKLLLAILIFLLSMCASFGLVFAVFGVTLLYKDGDQLASLIGNMAPLIGGLYFPVTVLPELLRYVAYMFPFTWGIELMRKILLGSKSITSVENGLVILAFLSFAYLAIGALVYKMLVKKARQRGVHGF